MGYCYSQSGRLVCDHCGQTGGVRKRRCTYGYCPSPALCSTCYKELKPELVKWHEEHCKEPHERFVAKKRKEEELLNQGKLLRWSAIGQDGKVKVTFRNKDYSKKPEFLVTKSVYDACKQQDIVTLEDMQKYGEMIPIGEMQ